MLAGGGAVGAATYALRETAWKAVENYVRGVVYYYTYDSDSRIVGTNVRTSMQQYGWAGDHYLNPHPNDQPYWPGQMYVRESVRMVGMMTLDANDICMTDGTTPRSVKTVSTASYAMDSHAMQRFAYNNGGTWQTLLEGSFYVAPGTGGACGADEIAPIPIEAITPKAADCTNMLVGFCLSATHAAFGATRMELSAMQLGQSIGMILAQCIDSGTTVQNVDYPTVRSRLLASPSYAGEIAPVLPQLN